MLRYLRFCWKPPGRSFSGLPKIRVDGDNDILRDAFPKLAKIALITTGSVITAILLLSEKYDPDIPTDQAVNLFQVSHSLV